VEYLVLRQIPYEASILEEWLFWQLSFSTPWVKPLLQHAEESGNTPIINPLGYPALIG